MILNDLETEIEYYKQKTVMLKPIYAFDDGVHLTICLSALGHSLFGAKACSCWEDFAWRSLCEALGVMTDLWLISVPLDKTTLTSVEKLKRTIAKTNLASCCKFSIPDLKVRLCIVCPNERARGGQANHRD